MSQVKEALIEQEEDIELETALAALKQEGDTDLEENDVQEMPLAYKESRQLRREQRVNCDQEYGVCSDDVSCQPSVALQDSGHGKFCIGVADEIQNCGSSRACEGEAKVDCQWSAWNSWHSCSVTCGEGQYNRSGFERGHWTRACTRSQEDKCSEMVKRRRHLSWSTSGETTALGKGVIDTGCKRFLIGQNTLDKWEQMLTRRWGLSTQRIQLAKAMTFRLGNDETLETKTLAILPVGIAGVDGVLRVYVVLGRAPLFLTKEFLRDLGCHIDLGRGHLFF